MKSDTGTIVPEQPHHGGAAALPGPRTLKGEVLNPESDSSSERRRTPRSSTGDINAVITKALKAAGLMKGR
jgi:hypothetical protein